MKQAAASSGDFQTSNNFYHQLTSESQGVMNQQAAVSNPVIDALDPSVFEVTAKKQSLMWQSQ
jgi:hypothetical protein